MIRLDVNNVVDALGAVSGIAIGWAIFVPAMRAIQNGLRKNGGQ
jgi:hypothetical protein